MVFDKPPTWIRLTSLLCTVLLIPGNPSMLMGQQAGQPAAASAPLDPGYLDSLVAPIALYPDPLLAQVLAASTYPLELVQLQQWLEQHKDLKDKALADAVEKQNWDPSVQAMAGLPDVLKELAGNIQWTTELGNAFLAQQSDVMAAVQRMRAKAQQSGNLKSTEQMKVETKTVDSQSVIVIQQANPQVIYVPSYDPAVVWGAAPYYPYPPIAYPPAGYYAAGMAISFGVGVAMGAFWGGGWGWNCGWGGNNNVYVNNNNFFNNNYNRNNNFNRNNIGNGNIAGNGNRWQHRPEHRGGAPYGDRATANRFGGTTRGDSLANRQASARQNLGQGTGQRGGQAGLGNRGSGAGNLGGNRGTGAANPPGNRGTGAGNLAQNRGTGAGTGNLTGNRGTGAGGPGGNSAFNRGTTGRTPNGGGRPSGMGGDRVGNRQVPSGSSRGAFGGGGGGFNGGAARASGSRGASSFRGGGGGGFRGGGGSRGGRRR